MGCKNAISRHSGAILLNTGSKITKNIGKIFRRINLFEFKSEKDGLTVGDYLKVFGYAYIYASFHGIDISDITISFAVTIYPRDLIKYLKKRGFTVLEAESGMYYVEGDTFPLQILESKKLSAETNLFLKNLRSNLSKEDVRHTVDAYKALKEFESKSVYFDRLLRANKSVFREVMRMSDEALQTMFARIVAEESGWAEMPDEALKKIFVKSVAKERGWLDRYTEKQRATEIAKAFKQDNIPLDTIVKNTGLTLQEVEAL